MKIFSNSKLFFISFFALLGFSLFIIAKSYSIFFESEINALAASIQDDSFYYIIPAFNFSNGNGFTFGGEKSYGFQVGYELLLVVVALFTNSIHELLRFSLLLNALLFAATGLIIYFIVVRVVASFENLEFPKGIAYVAGLTASIIYLSNYWNFFNSITAKENALAAFLLSVAIYFSLRNDGDNKSRNALAAGLVCGFLFLTRPVPSTILYLAVFAWVYKCSFKFFISAAATPILGWAIFSGIYFNAVVPFPAQIKVSVSSAPFGHDVIIKAFEYFLTSIRFGIFGPSNVMLPQPNWIDALRPQGVEIALFVGLLLFASCFFILLLKQRRAKEFSGILIFRCVLACAVGSILMGVSMAIKRPAEIYYASWYFYDSPVVLSVLFGIGFFLFTDKAMSLLGKYFKPLPSLTIALILLSGLKMVEHYDRFVPYTETDFEAGVNAERWQNVMIASALWLKEYDKNWHAKKVAAYSSGALGFTLEDRVINLDGLANNNVARSLLDGRPVDEYLLASRPDYFIDIGKVNPVSKNVELDRLHTLPFSPYSGYQVSSFVYGEGGR